VAAYGTNLSSNPEPASESNNLIASSVDFMGDEIRGHVLEAIGYIVE